MRETNSRRAFIKTGALGVTAAIAASSVAAAVPASATQPIVPGPGPLPVTPACSGHETPASVEGPLYKPESPRRTNLVTPGINGVRLDLRGIVYAPDCTVVSGALIEFWQCDQNGDYDINGFTLRGHQFTATDGSYRLETIVPRDYYGRWGRRAPHIHTQVQAPNGPILLTQLYFPDDTQAYGRDFATLNATDNLINRACTVALTSAGGGYSARFDFVIKTAVDPV
ncbi:dioxygenase [Lentzea sp. NPDC051213]|uniref:dioxygenase family protein n=1 Tax=Lentzea sp. NPDC051213 TaxID=3364126 RepID=UPI00378A859C